MKLLKSEQYLQLIIMKLLKIKQVLIIMKLLEIKHFKINY